jgi:hypothetical protein
MRWKANNEIFLLVLILALEGSWIILCNHNKVLRHQFWALTAFVSCRALSPCYGHPQVASNPSFVLVGYKLSSRRHIRF